MKLERQATEYKGTGPIERRKFEVADTVMLAQLLSNMYSDPVLAVIREYICNAIDSHKAAGESRPVKICLPTLFQQDFIVKDFGLGMSDEQVMKLFSTYGSSSKRQTNEMIGGFGIGSKAAFAYTDNFTVESIYNGEKLSYVASMCEENGPTIELLSRTSTSDHNGFTVKIPVKKTDLNTFRSKLVDFIKYIDDEPFEVVGTDWEPSELVKEITHKDWTVKWFKFKDKHEGNYVKIKMGPVVYDAGELYKWSSPWIITPVLECPIGTFPIAPDRESIIIKPETKQEILDYLEEVQNLVNDQLIVEVQAQPTLWRAWQTYENKSSYILRHTKFRWKDKTTDKVSLKKAVKTIRYLIYCKNPFHSDTKRIFHLKEVDLFVDMQGRRTGHRDVIKNWLNSDEKHRFKKAIILPENKIERLRMWITLGRPEIPVITYDDWRVLEKTTGPKERQEVKFKVVDLVKQSYKNQMVPTGDNQRRVYIPINSNQIEALGKRIAFSYHPSDVVSICKIVGVREREVILVPRTLQKRVPDEWVNLQPLIEQSFKDLSEMKIWARKQSFENIANPSNYVHSRWYEILNNMYKEIHSWNEIYSNYGIRFPEKVQNSPEIFFPYQKYCERFVKLINKENEKFDKDYPLIHNNLSIRMELPVIDYINMSNHWKSIGDKNYKPRFKPKKKKERCDIKTS